MYRPLLLTAFVLAVLAFEHAHTTPELKIVDSIQEGDMVRYAYVGAEVPELLEDEEVKEKRTESSYTVYLGKDEHGNDIYRARTYTAPTFVRNGLAWHTVEYGTDTQENFLAKTKSSIASRIARAIVPPTYAVTVFAGAGDESTGIYAASWAAARSATEGTHLGFDGDTGSINVASLSFNDGGLTYSVNRGFLPFNTGATLPADASVTAATINVRVYFDSGGSSDNDGDDFLTVVETTQATHTGITIEDFDQAGSTEGVATGDRFDFSGVPEDEYISLTLNATGRGWIKRSGEASSCSATAGYTCLGLREGHDLLNSSIGSEVSSGSGFYPSESSGTTHDPYLDITYTEGSGMATLSRPPNNLGLVAYWSLDDGTGIVATDFSGGRRSGVLDNGPTWVPGKRGKAVSFDGADDYVSLANDAALSPGTTGFTVSAWFKTDPDCLAGFGCAIYNDNGSGQAAVQLAIGGEGVGLYGYIREASGDQLVINSGIESVTDGQWHHVVLVRETTTTARLYLDGVDEGSVTNGAVGSVITDDGTIPAIGINSPTFDPCCAFDGQIDEVRIYNRALGANEVAALARAGAARIGASSVDLARGSSLEQSIAGHWTFDGKDTTWTSASAGTVTDVSGGGTTATLTNMSRSTSPIGGMLGQGFNFDGTNDFVDAPVATDPTAYTISAWVKPTDVTSTNIFVRTTAGQQATLFSHQLRITSGSKFQAYTYDGVSQSVLGTSDVVANTWHHVVTTAENGGSLRLYVNGVEEGTPDTIGTLWTSGDRYYIGSNSGDGMGYFSGIIDDVRLYHRALTATEVKQLYNLGQVRIVQ